MLEIIGTKEFITENPIQQIWKLLHHFYDVEYTLKQIKRKHRIIDNKQDKNIRKQAVQISFCIKQAEQYFNASSTVDLSTRPTLIYYGVLNLSHALILLEKDGNYSFDALRKKEKIYDNHGLDLVKQIKSIQSSEAKDFFANIKCKLRTNEEGNIGQFPVFYESLTRPAFCIHERIHDSDKSTYVERDIAHPTVDIFPLSKLKDKEINILDLIKGLPDLYLDLADFGILPSLSPGNTNRTVVKSHSKNPTTGDTKIDKITITDDYLIDGIYDPQKKNLIEFYSKKIPDVKIVADFGSNLHLQHIREIIPEVEQTATQNYYPDIVENISGKKFYVHDVDNYLSEPAAFYAITFCLGMLSRYYPDIWMKTINEQASVSELADTILNTVYRKFPNLILDQLTSIKHNVHL